MNFGTMKTELADRGFDALSVARRAQIINDAVAELDEQANWPYREASTTGLAPLPVADLGIIERVVNISQPLQLLEPVQYSQLVQEYGDLSIAGIPSCYYVAWPAGTPVVATYPTSTNTIGVQYWKVTAQLSSDADVPAAPVRFHQIYMLIAQRMAESERGNLSVAQGLQNEIDIATGRMGMALLNGQQLQGPYDYQRMMGTSVDG